MDKGLLVLLVALATTIVASVVCTIVRRGFRQHRWRLAVKEILRGVTVMGIFLWIVSLLVVIMLALGTLLIHLKATLDASGGMSTLLDSAFAVTMIGIIILICWRMPIVPIPKYSSSEEAILDIEDAEFVSSHPKAALIRNRVREWMQEIGLVSWS